jgi:hypothetical protein
MLCNVSKLLDRSMGLLPIKANIWLGIFVNASLCRGKWFVDETWGELWLQTWAISCFSMPKRKVNFSKYVKMMTGWWIQRLFTSMNGWDPLSVDDMIKLQVLILHASYFCSVTHVALDAHTWLTWLSNEPNKPSIDVIESWLASSQKYADVKSSFYSHAWQKLLTHW